MAAYFIDLDGVFFKFGTLKPTEGAIDFVNNLFSSGHQVYFTTLRTYQNNWPEHLNLNATKEVLSILNVHYTAIIGSVSSPRILINDEGAIAVNHKKNSQLSDNFYFSLDKDQLAKKLYHGFIAIAWVAWKYESHVDADEYVQTMLIAKSLISYNGFNHSDIVKRYKSKPIYHLNGQQLFYGGTAKNYQGQISKLLKSDNPLYISSDG